MGEDNAKTPEIVIESKVQIEQKYDAEGLLHNEIDIRGWEYDQAIKTKQQELAKGENDLADLRGRLQDQVTRATTEATKEDVKLLKELCEKLGIEKEVTCQVQAGLSEDGETVSYGLLFNFNCRGSGKTPAPAEAKSIRSTIKSKEEEIKALQEEINGMRLAKDNDVLAMKILAGKSKRQMAMQDKAGFALIKGLVEAVRPQLPAPKQ
ncbi:MAG: hypothetical protein ABFE07_29240 [Armatimonadia bacterium]